MNTIMAVSVVAVYIYIYIYQEFTNHQLWNPKKELLDSLERESYTLLTGSVAVLASNKIGKIIQDSFIKHAIFVCAL